MIKKKVCLVGGFAVGKTSLIQQYVKGIFSEDYLTTVGVKIDQRTERIQDQDLLFMIWDLAGRDEFAAVKKSYLRGANGIIYVADGTRRETLAAAREEFVEIEASNPDAHCQLLLNKCDLTDDWEVSEDDLAFFRERDLSILSTSAKTGEHVADAFQLLAGSMLGVKPAS